MGGGIKGTTFINDKSEERGKSIERYRISAYWDGDFSFRLSLLFKVCRGKDFPS